MSERFEKLIEQREINDYEHDRKAPWWKAKKRPTNAFEKHPLIYTAIMVSWLVVGIVPVILMIMNK